MGRIRRRRESGNSPLRGIDATAHARRHGALEPLGDAPECRRASGAAAGGYTQEASMKPRNVVLTARRAVTLTVAGYGALLLLALLVRPV